MGEKINFLLPLAVRYYIFLINEAFMWMSLRLVLTLLLSPVGQGINPWNNQELYL